MGGFIYQYLGWRWINWIVLIGGGISFAGHALCKETYAPVLLKAKRKRKQQDTGYPQWWCQYDDDEGLNWWIMMRTYLYRPLSMAIFEPIW